MATKKVPTSAKKKDRSKAKAAPSTPSDNTTGKTADYGEDNLTVGGFAKADKELYDLMCVWVKKNGAPPAVEDFPPPALFHHACPTMQRFSHKSFGQRYLKHKNTIKKHNWVPPPYAVRGRPVRPGMKAAVHSPPDQEPEDAADDEGSSSDEDDEETSHKEEDVNGDDSISIASSNSSDDDEDEDEEEEEEDMIISDCDSDTESEEDDGDPHCMSDF